MKTPSFSFPYGAPIGHLASRFRGRQWLTDDRIWFIAVLVLCVALYAPTLSPSVVLGDGGELQMLSYVAGVSHRTGYPLYLILGWVVTHLPLGGDAAFRLTLFSMCSAAAAVAVFFLLLRELGVQRSIAILSSIVLASAPQLWIHAAAAEVYPLAIFFLVLGSLLLVRWGQGKTPLWTVTLVFGLALAHHISIRLLGPAVLFYLLLVDHRLPLRPRHWMPALATLLVPLGLYAYVPLRAHHFLSMPALQGQIVGVSKAVASGYVSPWYVSSGPVEYFIVSGYSGSVLGGIFPSREALAQLWGIWSYQAPVLIVLPLTLLGLGTMLVRRARVGVYFLLAFLIPAWAALRFLGEVGGEVNQLLGTWVLVILWFAVGAQALVRWLEARRRLRNWLPALPVVLLALVAVYNIAAGFPEALQRRQTEIRAEAQDILVEPLPPGAVIAGPWVETTPLRYLQRVEGVRPDLWIIHANEQGIRDVLLPAAQTGATPLYVLRTTEAGLRLLPLVQEEMASASHPADLVLGDIVRWHGYDLPDDTISPGTVLPLTVYWEVEAPIDRDWKTFIHLVDSQGQLAAQVDRVALGQLHPPSEWAVGERLADQYELSIPPDLPPGQYDLLFGWYGESGRLTWEDGLESRRMTTISVK